jgi:hypothetical protein
MGQHHLVIGRSSGQLELLLFSKHHTRPTLSSSMKLLLRLPPTPAHSLSLCSTEQKKETSGLSTAYRPAKNHLERADFLSPGLMMMMTAYATTATSSQHGWLPVEEEAGLGRPGFPSQSMLLGLQNQRKSFRLVLPAHS